MWRAEVIHRVSDGWVLVKIPSLYGEDPIGPLQSAVDAQTGERVVIADLAPQAKVRDWWVIGYESMIGRWGEAYAHTHPTGQVTGLNETGTETTLTEILAEKANLSDIPADQDLSGYVTDSELTTTLSNYVTQEQLPADQDLSGYVTDAELTTALSGYATDTELAGYVTDSELITALSPYAKTASLSNKANLPDPWATLTSSYWVADTAESRALSVRQTPFGMQMSGRVRLTSAVTRDVQLTTMPGGSVPSFYPPFGMILNIAAMGPGTAYAALTYQFELHTDGRITARQDMLNGARLTFNETLIY